MSPWKIKNKKPFSLSFGRRGEMAGWAYLVQHGFRILEKNYRCSLGEIDVVAEKDGRIRFIEIKTRRHRRFGSPEEAVSRGKQKQLGRLAQVYLKHRFEQNRAVSFDVVAIDWRESEEPEIRLIENAFTLDSDPG